ncbi:MAG: type II toxin-antitoxin system RelE/ParE family toxin [Saprospiraceae bacterium]
MNQVIVSPKAEEAYLSILEYYYQFSADFAVKLDDALERLIENLRRFKKLCPASRSFPNVRRCVLTENISMIYRIEGKAIHIVSFFDSRTDHLF